VPLREQVPESGNLPDHAGPSDAGELDAPGAERQPDEN